MLDNIMKLHTKRQEIYDQVSKQKLTVYEAEQAIKELAHEFERLCQEDLPNHLSEPTTENKIKCLCGHHATYKDVRTKSLHTGRTTLSMTRRRYFCPSCKRTIYPMDEIYGLVNVREYSPLMASIMGYLGAKESFDEVRADLAELLSIQVSSTATQNQAEKLGKEILENRFAFIPPEVSRPCIRMMIFADGGMLHTGKEKYNEVRVGVLVKYYADGTNSVHKYAQCESSQDFNRDFYRFCMVHGSDTCSDIAIVGDGASWLDSLKKDYFPNAKRIIDYYHAKEYLIIALSEQYGKDWAAEKTSQYLLGLLEIGDCEAIVYELEACKNAKDKDSAVYHARRYYKNHAEMMKYKTFEEQGYGIGSGEVEGAVRHIVHDRMGKSRSMWTIEDANAILILRAYLVNGYWQRIKELRYQRFVRSA